MGSVIYATGDLSLKADNIAIKGSSIGSELGNTILVAENDINITEGRKVTDIEQAYKIESKGLLSSSTREGYKRDQSDQSLASVIKGKQVLIDANNVNIRGSQVISDDLTQIQAKENISITAAEDHRLTASKDVLKKSGLMSTGGIGFSIGMEKDTTIQSATELTHTGSTVGSLNGNTNLIAGNHYQVGLTQKISMSRNSKY